MRYLSNLRYLITVRRKMKIKDYRKDIITIIVTVILSLVIIFFSKFIYNSGFLSDNLYQGAEYYRAEVCEVLENKLNDDKYIEGMELGQQEIKVQILDGPYKGNEYTITNNLSRLYNVKAEEGTKVIIAMYFVNNELNNIAVSSYERSNVLAVMIILFLVIVAVIGGIKGVKSIISLLFTIVCIIFLMLPLMFRGINLIVVVISITVTLILVSGMNKKSLSAIIGTVLGVFISGMLAYIFGNCAHLSGFTMSDAESVMYIAESTELKIKGIMFAGILIASLGAVMDVAMSISSSIFEINSINERMTVLNLFKSGMNIGRDIIGTMTNTLILAFAGGSLNTLILIFAASMNSNRLFNLEILGTEIIQGLAGSMGIVLTVPITAIVSAYLCGYSRKK